MRLIYRRSDYLIVGNVTPPQPEALEILNITRSELGGVPTDYAVTAECPSLPYEQMYQVGVGGVVTTIPDSQAVQRDILRRSAIQKLVTLGLTRAEIRALVGM